MSAPTVLLYNLDPEKGRRIKLLCLSLKLRARTVSPAEYGLTLAALLNGEKPEGEDPESFGEEMLVMADLSSGQMNSLLLGLRRKKIPPVSLKAVTTASNLQWDSKKLRDELVLEHQAMLQGKRAHGEGSAD